LAADTQIPINGSRDVVAARQEGRAVALQAGFSLSEATLIATTISELARNIVSYAACGCITLKRLKGSEGSRGLTIIATDSGPGITDIAQALRDGFSSSGGLGLGLPGVRRLMDEFEIDSQPGAGTTVTVTKWHL
jgi:serine/threonine-protein kinase RsbT